MLGNIRYVAVRLLRFTCIQSLNEASVFVAVDVPAAGGARTIIASLPPST